MGSGVFLRRSALTGSAVLGAVALAFGFPGTASAAVMLTNQTPIRSSQLTSYELRTSTPRWSVVSLRATAGAMADLQVRGTGLVATSQTRATDFVLIDSNPGELALDKYTATVFQAPPPPSPVPSPTVAAGPYSIRFYEGTRLLTKPTNLSPSAGRVLQTTSGTPVVTYRLSLRPDEGFRLLYPPHTHVYVINDNPATTWSKLIDRQSAESRNIVAGGALAGAWTIGDAEHGGCVAFAEPGFSPASTPVLVLVDDDPDGSAGKTFHPFAYNRNTDPQRQCPTL